MRKLLTALFLLCFVGSYSQIVFSTTATKIHYSSPTIPDTIPKNINTILWRFTPAANDTFGSIFVKDNKNNVATITFLQTGDTSNQQLYDRIIYYTKDQTNLRSQPTYRQNHFGFQDVRNSLSQSGASNGQTLTWNNSNWTAKDIDAIDTIYRPVSNDSIRYKKGTHTYSVNVSSKNLWDTAGGIFQNTVTSLPVVITSSSVASQIELGAAGVEISNSYTLPTSDGTIGQVMATDGAGVADWVSVVGVTGATGATGSTGATGVTGATGPTWVGDYIPLRTADTVGVSKGSWTWVVSSSAIYGGWWQNSGTFAQNDSCNYKFAVTGGTYKIAAYFSRTTSNAIVTFLIDGVSVGTVDTYGAFLFILYGSIYNVAMTQGEHTLTIKAATKNASSSAYYTSVSSITIQRTGN